MSTSSVASPSQQMRFSTAPLWFTKLLFRFREKNKTYSCTLWRFFASNNPTCKLWPSWTYLLTKKQMCPVDILKTLHCKRNSEESSMSQHRAQSFWLAICDQHLILTVTFNWDLHWHFLHVCIFRIANVSSCRFKRLANATIFSN